MADKPHITLAGVTFTYADQLVIEDYVTENDTSVLLEELGELIDFLQFVKSDYDKKQAAAVETARLEKWNKGEPIVSGGEDFWWCALK